MRMTTRKSIALEIQFDLMVELLLRVKLGLRLQYVHPRLSVRGWKYEVRDSRVLEADVARCHWWIQMAVTRFRGEKIDDEYERDCKIKINQLLQDYNGLDIEMRKKERVSIEEKYLAASKRDEHIDTIPEKESDELIKSSVENLIPIPSESEVTFDNKSECDMPVCDDFTTFSNPLFDSNDDFTSSDDESLSDEDIPMENFKIYSNPLFDDEEIISLKIDPHYFNAESNLIESLLNRDILIDSSPKFDYFLEEFSGELSHIDPIPPGIKKADFDLEEEIRFVENLLYDNSSPRPPEELNLEIADTILESLSPFPILVEDSDSHMEEIDLFLAINDSMPLGIEDDDYDSEGDIRFPEEFLNNDSLPLPENESSNLDHFNDSSPSRSPPKPPDIEICFDFKPNTGVVTNKVVGDISEHDVFMPNLLATQPTLCPVIFKDCEDPCLFSILQSSGL
ncbi:hypothetical protein Tco_0193874 [Tanacetum coccineum]